MIYSPFFAATEFWYSEPVYNGLPIEGAAPELVGVEQADGTVWVKPSCSGWQKGSADALMQAGYTKGFACGFVAI